MSSDASIAVKWLVEEAYSDEAASLLEWRDAPVAPDLMFAEAVNALWAMRRRDDVTREDVAEAVGVLKAAPVAFPAPMGRLAPSAARLALDLDHPAYDCYLALALQEQLRVVTADRRFLEVVRKHPYLSDRIVHVESLRAD